MQILSALDAISPAFSRTKLVLFSPFRKGRTWKLAATAYLATASTIFMPFPLIYLFFVPSARHAGGTLLAVGLLVAVLLLTAICLVCFYLFTRIRFTFFDIVLNRGEFVAPAWRRYGPQSLKWTAFKVLLGTVVTLALAAPIASYARHFFLILTSIKPGQQPSPELMAGFFAGYLLVYGAFGLGFFISSLLSDFIVPSLALENTTLQEAFLRFGRLISGEPGQVAAYALIKLGLGFAGYMGAVMVFEIVFLIAMIIVAIVAGLIGLMLHLIGVPTALLIGLGIALAIVCYLFFFFYCAVIIMGTTLTFLESYTLYFLGGRYPMLGDLLDRSTPPAAVPSMYPPPGYFMPPPPIGSAPTA